MDQRFRLRERVLLGVFYLFFALFYAVILEIQLPEEFRTGLNWRIVYLDYPLKAIFTLPIWYMVFRQFRHWSFVARICLTLILLPVWASGWQQIYYWLVDQFFGGIHLEGDSQWLDIYVSTLFYCIQFGAFYAYEYHLNFRRSERERAESTRLALAAELSSLKAQLNPHFLYNAFNAISASVSAEQEETRELIAQLSDMFRYQLRAARADEVPLIEEINFVQDYLTLEKARFEDRLRVTIDVPDELHQAAIPPMLLQPLVENAVRHGISPLLDGGVVTILASANNATLKLEISDSGVGISPEKMAASNGFGLANTRRRLQLLFNRDLFISQPATGGTLLQIEIPLKYVTKSSPDRRRSARAQTPPAVPSRI